MRVGVVGRDAHGLAERGNARGIVAGLNQHEAEIVVGLGVFGPQADGFAKFRGDRRAVGALLAEHAARGRCAPPRLPGFPASACRSAAMARIPVGRGPCRRRKVKAGLELPERPWRASPPAKNVIARST